MSDGLYFSMRRFLKRVIRRGHVKLGQKLYHIPKKRTP